MEFGPEQKLPGTVPTIDGVCQHGGKGGGGDVKDGVPSVDSVEQDHTITLVFKKGRETASDPGKKGGGNNSLSARNSGSTRTGDNMNPVVYAGLSGGTLFALAVWYLIYKKRRQVR